MRAQELILLLHKQPFKPLRLHITGGQHVDILHPEMAIVGRSLVAVGLPWKGLIADGVVHYNLLHIVKISFPHRNGRRKRRIAPSN